jgi:PAS domain S-box-containing protein
MAEPTDPRTRLPPKGAPRLLLTAGLAAVYFVLARAGLGIHPVERFATLVWPPSGISVAALLYFGPALWPGVALGAFLANLFTGAPPAVALGIAAGNTGEALFAVWALRRIVGFRTSLDRLQDALGLVLIGGLVAPFISATVGVASLRLGGLLAADAAGATWRAWWLGDAIAILVLAPVLLTVRPEKRSAPPGRRLESFGLALLLALATLFLFYLSRERLSVVVAPFLIWAAVRFEVRGAARAVFFGAVIAVWATLHGSGPFADAPVELGLQRLQAQLATTASTFLVLGAMTAERRRADRERRRAEDQIRDSEARYRSMIDAVEQLMWISHPNGDVAYLNRRWEEAVGPRPVALGRGWFQYVHPDDEEELRRIRSQAVAAGRPYTLDFRLRTLAGYRWTLTRVVPVRGEDGAINAWVGAAADVHDLKTAQEELRQARDQAQEASRSKDRFLATLSHELRTPLTPVLALASRLERDPDLGPEARRSVEVIRRNAELEARLIDDLLDVTRVAAGKLEIRPETVSLLVVLDDAVETFAAEAEAGGVELVREPGEDAWLRADPARLRQVIGNIVHNAVKFTPRGGRVTLRRAEAPAGRVAIEIADTGSGIDPGDISRIFRPFEQASRGKAGLGLGLSISRNLVEAHGGKLSAESRGEGEGSVFRIELPGPVDAPAAAPRRTRPPSPAAGPGRRVLLVEDHADTALAARELLADASCQVVAAGSLAEALEAAGIQTFDLVLSDLGLPDGSGLDLMRNLRDRYGLRGIALTGFGMEEDVTRSREAGFVDHLVKPITYDRLAKAIERFFDDRAGKA